MIYHPSIRLKVQGIVSETSIIDDCSAKFEEHELCFILNRNPNASTLTLNINDKQAYIIDAEIAKKILELIQPPTIYLEECPKCFGKGRKYSESYGEIVWLICENCIGTGYKNKQHDNS